MIIDTIGYPSVDGCWWSNSVSTRMMSRLGKGLHYLISCIQLWYSIKIFWNTEDLSIFINIYETEFQRESLFQTLVKSRRIRFLRRGRWSFWRPWTRAFLSSTVLELQVRSCAALMAVILVIYESYVSHIVVVFGRILSYFSRCSQVPQSSIVPCCFHLFCHFPIQCFLWNLGGWVSKADGSAWLYALPLLHFAASQWG